MMKQTADSNIRSDLYPRVGELWDCQGRIAFICGNSISESGRIWVADWETGQRGNAELTWLELRDDRKSLAEEAILGKFIFWAREGNSDAIWWLAWWFEGENHRASTWFYVAALRVDPTTHGWAFERIVSDAHSPIMCADVPKPDLAFLNEIPEMRGQPLQRDWASAVACAEASLKNVTRDDYPSLECPICTRVTKPRSLNKDGSVTYSCSEYHLHNANSYSWRITADGALVDCLGPD